LEEYSHMYRGVAWRCQLLVGGKFVVQHVGVGSHDRVADLYGTTFQVIGRTDETEHRDARSKPQKPHLIRCRHPSGHFLSEPFEGVSEFFDPSVDTARARIRVLDGRPASDIGGDVGRSRFNGLAVQGVSPTTYDDRDIVPKFEEVCDLSWRYCLADLDH